jgi:inner membrane protein
MHIPTHILSGWVVASAVPSLTPRERLFAMAAATAPDLDGLAIVAGRDAFETYHHVVGHNLFFGVLVATLLAAWSTHKGTMALLALGLFHLHLVMDSFGSGCDWGISYLWPLVQREWVNPWRWEFFSWQNLVAAYGLVLVTIVIAIKQGRTPLEMIAPTLDRQLVALARRLRPGSAGDGNA